MDIFLNLQIVSLRKGLSFWNYGYFSYIVKMTNYWHHICYLSHLIMPSFSQTCWFFLQVVMQTYNTTPPHPPLLHPLLLYFDPIIFLNFFCCPFPIFHPKSFLPLSWSPHLKSCPFPSSYPSFVVSHLYFVIILFFVLNLTPLLLVSLW